jgi:hypothetical protein
MARRITSCTIPKNACPVRFFIFYPWTINISFHQNPKPTCHDQNSKLSNSIGGKGGIRTLGGPKPTTVFETVPFNHSGTFPFRFVILKPCGGYYNRCLCAHLHSLAPSHLGPGQVCMPVQVSTAAQRTAPPLSAIQISARLQFCSRMQFWIVHLAHILFH